MTTCPKVLVIDDEAMLRATMRAFFEDLEFQVVEAANGQEGLELFRRELPDLVITDLRMPVMDGFGVIEVLKREFPETPVIVVSGAGTLGDAIKAVRLGAWDYITKPIQELEELEIIARSVMERARLITENAAYQEHLEELVTQRTGELRDSEALHRTLFETAGDAILILKDTGDVVAANPRAEDLFALPLSELTGQSISALSSRNKPDGAESEQLISKFLRKALAGETCHFEWCYRYIGHESCDAEISLNRLELQGVWYLQAIIHDITERKGYEERLFHQANYDALTGLPNRHLLSVRLEYLLQDARSSNTLLILVLLDIDQFKNINDIMGHNRGDEVLRQVACRAGDSCAPGDFLARFVGDEFVIVRTGCSTVSEATVMARKFLQAFDAPYPVGQIEMDITASVGVVISAGDQDETPVTLLKNAEAAMFSAKKQGQGMIQIFSQELNREAELRLSLENRLRKAVEREEFRLHYQPQIDIATGAIIGAEALLRWTPSGEEMVYPDRFIPILEATGLIVPVGEWVIHETCRQARAWLDLGLPPIRMSVNITAWHLYSGKLLETVISSLAESDLDPSMLCLEVTESMFLHDISAAMQTLQRLHNLGVLLSIDDFGTGYSSLSYLTRMPIHELKIDRSFIRDIPGDAGSAAIVTTVLSMAESLRLTVVAEGVETLEQYRFLAGLQCHMVQGFLFSKALPPEDFVSYLTKWKRPTDEVEG
jgi:diguanylate cyclase (GGDEF)-like protein/PAS domain S-box-containing protein